MRKGLDPRVFVRILTISGCGGILAFILNPINNTFSMKNKIDSIINDIIFHVGFIVLGVAFIILTTNLHKLCL